MTKSCMTHNGYLARVEYDADDHIFFGRLLGINDVIGFHAETVADLEEAFRAAVQDYIDMCTKLGKKPEKPYSGQVMFRISPETHARAALAAQAAGMSLNQWADETLARRAAEVLPAAVVTGSAQPR